MTKELEKRLTDRFPFMRTSGDVKKDLMVFGCECNDGWFDIIWKLCEGLEETEKYNEDFQVVQVKEKYGDLRFYVNHATDEGWGLIDKAEKTSEFICEICGGPSEGIYWETGWAINYCDKCMEERK